MTSTIQNQINRLKNEIADLHKSDARETKREASLVAKINRSNEAFFRTKNISTRQSKAREVERAQKELANVKTKKANLSKKIADKEKQLAVYQERQSKGKRREIKRQSDLEKRLGRKHEQYMRRIAREVQSEAKIQSLASETFQPVSKQGIIYDFFISHASEDKDGFVRDLAKTLEAEGAKFGLMRLS